MVYAGCNGAGQSPRGTERIVSDLSLAAQIGIGALAFFTPIIGGLIVVWAFERGVDALDAMRAGGRRLFARKRS